MAVLKTCSAGEVSTVLLFRISILSSWIDTSVLRACAAIVAGFGVRGTSRTVEVGFIDCGLSEERLHAACTGCAY